MTDLDDLEARKTRLTRAVEEATAERDEVRRQLAEARGEPLPPPPRRPRKPPRWLSPVLALLGVAGIAAAAMTDHAWLHPAASCADVARSPAAFERAVAAKGLRLVPHTTGGMYRHGDLDITGPEGLELVRDGKGGVWSVRRMPHEHEQGLYIIHACCFSGGGAAMMWHFRLEPGESLQGEVVIEYDDDVPRVFYDGPECLPPV